MKNACLGHQATATDCGYTRWMPLRSAGLIAMKTGCPCRAPHSMPKEKIARCAMAGQFAQYRGHHAFHCQGRAQLHDSVSALMRREDFPADTPPLDRILADCPEVLANGGSCIAAPNGEWVIPPSVGTECLLVATLDRNEVRRERRISIRPGIIPGRT